MKKNLDTGRKMLRDERKDKSSQKVHEEQKCNLWDDRNPSNTPLKIPF